MVPGVVLELALLAVKTALVLVSRIHILKPAYDERGEKTFQVGIVPPRGSLPVRVSRVP